MGLDLQSVSYLSMEINLHVVHIYMVILLGCISTHNSGSGFIVDKICPRVYDKLATFLHIIQSQIDRQTQRWRTP